MTFYVEFCFRARTRLASKSVSFEDICVKHEQILVAYNVSGRNAQHGL